MIRFTDGGVGGLLAATLSPAGGFGKFLTVLLALSIVGNNIPNMVRLLLLSFDRILILSSSQYSFALTFQVLGKTAQKIPRVFLVLVGTVIYIVLAIVGASHFEAWLDTLLVLLSYWLCIYSTILIEEHFIFRHGKWSNYNPDDYDKPQHLPLGAAAAFAAACGVMGAVLGMATLWYIGVLGKKSKSTFFNLIPSSLLNCLLRAVGDPEFGGDIGFELSFAFSAVVYPIARYIERKFESPERFRTSVNSVETEKF